jgi:hypothetical protein
VDLSAPLAECLSLPAWQHKQRARLRIAGSQSHAMRHLRPRVSGLRARCRSQCPPLPPSWMPPLRACALWARGVAKCLVVASPELTKHIRFLLALRRLTHQSGWSIITGIFRIPAAAISRAIPTSSPSLEPTPPPSHASFLAHVCILGHVYSARIGALVSLSSRKVLCHSSKIPEHFHSLFFSLRRKRGGADAPGTAIWDLSTP